MAEFRGYYGKLAVWRRTAALVPLSWMCSGGKLSPCVLDSKRVSERRPGPGGRAPNTSSAQLPRQGSLLQSCGSF
jgi:hypothetical protein